MWAKLEQQVQEEMKKREKEETVLKLKPSLTNSEQRNREEKKKEKNEEGLVKESTEATEERTEDDLEDVQTANEVKMPEWLEKYIIYKFNLYDRTGNYIL